MISEGSCDTKDWSNDAENVFKQKTVILNCNNILQLLLYLYQMNAPWWASDFFQKH